MIVTIDPENISIMSQLLHGKALELAIGVFPADVMGIDCDYGDAHFLSLVFNERLDLVESLRIMDVPFAFPNGCPHPYSF